MKVINNITKTEHEMTKGKDFSNRVFYKVGNSYYNAQYFRRNYTIVKS